MQNIFKISSTIYLSLIIANNSFAEGSPANAPGFGVVQFLMIGVLLLVFYFLVLRPQIKKQKAHRELIASVKAGDEVTLATGILGIIKKTLDDNYIQVSLGENIEIITQKNAIISILPKGTIKDLGTNSTQTTKKATDKDKKK